MNEEIKTNVEIREDELEDVSGGAFESEAGCVMSGSMLRERKGDEP